MSRFAGNEVLTYLCENGPSTVAEIAKDTGFGRTAIRNNLRVMSDPRYGQPWVHQFREDRPVQWALTEPGRRAATYRTRNAP